MLPSLDCGDDVPEFLLDLEIIGADLISFRLFFGLRAILGAFDSSGIETIGRDFTSYIFEGN